jgi:hypothetical protein
MPHHRANLAAFALVAAVIAVSAPTTLPGGTQIQASVCTHALKDYLSSKAPADRIESAGVRSTGLNAPVTRLTVLSKS